MQRYFTFKLKALSPITDIVCITDSNPSPFGTPLVLSPISSPPPALPCFPFSLLFYLSTKPPSLPVELMSQI